MKFELLPNEILIECFEYLNGFEIFYSFDQLNNRFNTLIHNIPLHINFQNINKSLFDQFRLKILLNPEIKNQIYSFQVLNKDQCSQATIFLSNFPVHEFSHLQKFELIIPTQILGFAPFLGEEDGLGSYLNIKLADIPLYKLHTLSIPYIRPSILDTHNISSIIKLRISQCDLNSIDSLLKQCPRLKYLHIGSMKYKWYHNTDKNQYGLQLKQLIIDDFNGQFENFQSFIKQIPNLKSLIISSAIHDDIINASQWEYLITSFLPYLKIFKFKFIYSLRRKDQNLIIDRFQQFQTDFWQKQHQWFTEYVIQRNSALIYTLPYPSNTYYLEQSEIRYSNNLNTFTNVTHLNIYPSIFTKTDPYYFPNVTSISLCTRRYESLFGADFIQYLKKLLNQCKVKELEIMNNLISKNPSDFLDLLKQTPYLSSLIIKSNSLQPCFENDELCQYLNKMIKQLRIHRSQRIYWKHIQINRFCEIFSNLEYLKCFIDDENDLLFLIEHLPKLSILEVIYTCQVDPEMKLNRLKKETEKLNIIFHMEKKFIEADTDEEDSKDFYSVIIFIWLNKNFSYQ